MRSPLSSDKNSLRYMNQLGYVPKKAEHADAKSSTSVRTFRKSWDSSHNKSIREGSLIDSKLPASSVNRRQLSPMSRMRNNQEVQGSSDRSQVNPSSHSLRPNNGEREVSSHSTPRYTSHPAISYFKPICNEPKPLSSVPRTNSADDIRDDHPPDYIDSTMLFPVGSYVKHRLHGRGVVQTPPNADAEFIEKMLVRVKFIDGNTEWDLPMEGLLHTYE